MERYTRDGLTFDVDDRGSGERGAVVLLHGFPETSASFDGIAGRLADAGYRTLAPDQRGYSPGARPTGRRAYAMDELVADVVALADAAGLDRFHLVGHDWGGGVAWATATAHPDRLATVTVLSTPHPQAFAKSLVTSGQLLRSWYMVAFQLPRLPERLILGRGADRITAQLVKSGLPEDKVGTYVERMREPGALTAMLNWYRGLPFSVDRSRPAAVTVPALYVWSDGDLALGRKAAELTADYVTGPYRFEVLEGVSHWIPEQAPERVTDLLLDHLTAEGDAASG